HLDVFDCAFKPQNGLRSINAMGHIRMMSAVQPFISGAISKTVNMAKESTAKDIADTYIEAWKLGIKAIAIYRDGSKRTQPLTTGNNEENKNETKAETITSNQPVRNRLPDERASITHKFSIAGHKGYITVGLFESGQPGEIFIIMAKEGSVISGLMDSFATSISVGLQYGVPLKDLCKKFSHSRFEPSGYTSHPNIRIAKSIVDYIFRWLALKFLPKADLISIGLNDLAEVSEVEQLEKPSVNQGHVLHTTKTEIKEEIKTGNEEVSVSVTFTEQEDAPPCDTCGNIMVRNAACYKCLNCGSSSGCS
ncbi:MAG TPA: vitamin B12-dependent ribonucleotide reductase, partial [Sulfurimonas sp.]|nr:vitamin B12-dependent ribonucleotide reductase [Sulfurimonas sp.]